MRIGILGGSFNPPHIGHLILAECAAGKLKLDKVIFVPANIPPLKKKNDLADAETRLEMIDLCIKDNSCFESSRVEIDRGGISYTIDTLRFFKKFFKNGVKLFFLAGSDVLDSLKSWNKLEEILKISEFVVVARKDFKNTSAISEKIKKIEMDAVEVSSSKIRKRIRSGESIRYLVPEAARNLILKRKLYTVQKENPIL